MHMSHMHTTMVWHFSTNKQTLRHIQCDRFLSFKCNDRFFLFRLFVGLGSDILKRKNKTNSPVIVFSHKNNSFKRNESYHKMIVCASKDTAISIEKWREKKNYSSFAERSAKIITTSTHTHTFGCFFLFERNSKWYLICFSFQCIRTHTLTCQATIIN